MLEIPLPLDEEKTTRWKGLVLAAFIPSMFAVPIMAIITFPQLHDLGAGLAYVAFAAALIIANPVLGVIVGRSVSRWRFFFAVVVALVGWCLGLFLGGIAYQLLTLLLTGAEPKQSETGWAMLIGMFAFFGMATSPIAGIAGAVDHWRRTKAAAEASSSTVR